MWLSVSLLEWYFDAVFASASDLGIIGIMPKVGAIALLAGIIFGFVQRQRSLLLFFIPVVTAHVFVAVAGLFERSITYPSNDGVATVPFLLVQVAICTYLVFKTARLASLSLAIFALTYSWFAGFIGAMALTGDWL